MMAPPGLSHVLPLPPNYFDTKALDTTTHDNIFHIARTCGAQLLQCAHAMDDLLVYAMHTDATSQRRMKLVLGKDGYDASLACMVGRTQFHASLSAVSTFFRSESLSRAANDGLVLDAHTLYTLVTPTPDEPLRYTAIKWVAHKMPTPPHRDYCYIESHSEFIDPKSSRRGWLRVVHSLEVPACPSLASSCGVKRSTWFRSGHVFLENANGLLDCYAVLTVPGDLAPTANEHYSMSFMRSWVTQVMALPNVLLTRRLATKSLVPPEALRPKDSVKMCMLCTTRFSLFSSKYNCRTCGHVVCSNCHITWTMAKKALRICLKCTASDGDAATATIKSSSSDSFMSTWHTTVASRRRHQLSKLSKSDVLEQSSSSCPELMLRDSFSSVDLTKSTSSDRAATLTPSKEPSIPHNYDHLFDFSVLQPQSPVDKATATPARPPPPPASSDPANDARRMSFSEGVVDVEALLLKSRRRTSSALDLHTGQSNPAIASNSMALHELLEHMYDGKSDAVQSLYRDLVA